MRKTLKCFILFLFVMLFSLAGFKSEASIGQVTGLKQVGDTTMGFKLEWNALLANGVRYEVSISDGKEWIIKQDYTPTSNNISISGLNAGSTYQVKVRAFTRKWNSSTSEYVNTYGSYSKVIEAVTSPNSNPGSLRHTSSSSNSVSVAWNAVPGANAYIVEYANRVSPNAYKRIEVSKPSAVIGKLSKNSMYHVSVYGIRKSSAGYKTKPSYNSSSKIWDVGVVPSKMKASVLSYYWQSISEVSLSCDRVLSAGGYQYQVKADKGNKTIKTVETKSNYSTNVKSGSFKKHRTFKARVRGYAINSSGKRYYGSWSDWVYFAPQPDVTGIKKMASGKLRVVWDKIDGASRYALYGSTKKSSGYKRIVTTTKTKYDVSKVLNKKLKAGKKYYFRVVAQKKVGSKFKNLSPGNANYCWYVTYR